LVSDWVKVLGLVIKGKGKVSDSERLSGVIWVWKRVVLIGIVISRYREGQYGYCMGRGML